MQSRSSQLVAAPLLLLGNVLDVCKAPRTAERGWCGCRNGDQLCPAKLNAAAGQGLEAGMELTQQTAACPIPALQWTVPSARLGG